MKQLTGTCASVGIAVRTCTVRFSLQAAETLTLVAVFQKIFRCLWRAYSVKL